MGMRGGSRFHRQAVTSSLSVVGTWNPAKRPPLTTRMVPGLVFRTMRQPPTPGCGSGASSSCCTRNGQSLGAGVVS